jgi:flagellar basal-body rod modification protein FlgD
MTIPSTNSSSASGTAATKADRVPKQTLGQDDFLKLLTVQLSKQDPLKPMDDSAFMGQMAQFSALEQSSQMSREMTALRGDVALQSSYNLIGREVTVDTSKGEVSGLVDSVTQTDAGAKISIAGQLYPFSSVTRVAAATPVQPQS